jgi:23S rRNA (adenine2030-N6)-methyltransferase
VIHLDGWRALGGHLPPKEKRGLVLVDPPFEDPGEFDRLVNGVLQAHRRWPGGTYALWYPLKDRSAVAAFRESLAGGGMPEILDVSFEIRPPSSSPRLDGCGLAIVNPPFVLEQELRIILPALQSVLAEGKGGSWRLTQLGTGAA